MLNNKSSDLKTFYYHLDEQLNQLEDDHPISMHFYDALESGDTTVYQKSIKETKKFDEEWIKMIESYMPSLNKIVLNPKSTLITHEEITIIEKAKNTNSQSIKHLSANSHLIKQIGLNGDVIPKKILTTYNEIDYGTYENRFIMTLIDRLVPFIKQRYDLIKKNVESVEKRRFYMHSDFPVNESNVELELKFLLTDKPKDNVQEDYNKSLLNRAEHLHKQILNLKMSNFMKMISDRKPIKPPIIKTNIILKNVDYHNCYMLWLFVDRYNTLPYELELEEKNLSFPVDYRNALKRQIFLIYSNIVSNQQKNKHIYEEIKPKKLTKKSIRVIRKHPDDFNLKLEDEIIEDHSLNQYYLEANKQIFRQSLEYHSETSKTYETTLKRALVDTLSITNALYQSFFELDGEEAEYFKFAYPIKEVDESLASLRTKSYIAKMIREVKGVDYNESITQELNYLDQILNHKVFLKDSYKEKETNEKESLLILSEKETIERLAKEERKIAILALEEANRLKSEVDNYRRRVLEEMRQFEKELKDNFNNKIKEHKAELKARQQAQINEYLEKYTPKKRVTNQQIKEEKELINQSRVQKEQELISSYEEKLSQTLLMLNDEHESFLAIEEENYKATYEQNESNINALKNFLNEVNQSLTYLENELIEHEKSTIETVITEQTKAKELKLNELKTKYKVNKIITEEDRDIKIRALTKRLQMMSDDLRAKYELRLSKKVEIIMSSVNSNQLETEYEIKKLKAETEKHLRQLQSVMYYFKMATSKLREIENDQKDN